jgi:hypothetical protein
LAETREHLRKRDPERVASLSGSEYKAVNGQAIVRVRFWDQLYSISWPDLMVTMEDSRACPNHDQAVILQYLYIADGTPLENSWVSLRNLPNGAFYEQAFQGYSGNLIAKAFRNNLEGFRAAASRCGGEPVSMGDAAYSFWILPRIPVALVFWAGGEEFADSVQVLFDPSACHYHHLEMMAHLGAILCERLLQSQPKS